MWHGVRRCQSEGPSFTPRAYDRGAIPREFLLRSSKQSSAPCVNDACAAANRSIRFGVHSQRKRSLFSGIAAILQALMTMPFALAAAVSHMKGRCDSVSSASEGGLDASLE